MLDAENPAEATDSSANTPAEDAGTPAGAPDTPRSDTAPAATEGAGEASVEDGPAPARKTAAKRAAAKKTTAKKTAAKKTTAKRTTRKAVEPETAQDPADPGAPAGATQQAAASADGSSAQAASAVEAEAAPAGGAALPAAEDAAENIAADAPAAKKTAKKAAAKKTTAKRASKKTAAAPQAETAADTTADVVPEAAPATPAETPAVAEGTAEQAAAAEKAVPSSATALLFQPPDPTKAVVTRRRRSTKAEAPSQEATTEDVGEQADRGDEAQKPAKKAAAKKTAKKSAKPKPEQVGESEESAQQRGKEPTEEPQEGADQATHDEGDEEQGGERRRRRRGGRRRRRSGGGEDNESAESGEDKGEDRDESADKGGQGEGEESEEAGTGTRRRRRRRRAGESAEGAPDEPENTVTRVRKPRNAEDEITALSGSTRLEAKKQRRREGREAGRRRAPIVSEAEFLARRESVDRVMVIRQREDLTQIAVLEDKVLVEHYVSRESQTSLIGNVYLGRVQNVLPSMEAAFIDIGKGRNAVLYAGEVNWDALGAKNGQPRKIEAVLKSGQPILVQVTKDPIGHKGARLTSQISLPGRFLVYVPDGTTSGISRKLPDTERNRLKTLLKDIVPESAGVIVRTAAEGASEEELTRDVERLTARWEDIEKKTSSGNAPQMLYGEPDLTLKVVRDLFTEDFNKLVIAGGDAWDLVDGYVSHVAPDLADRLERYDGERDVFSAYRIDEQIEKALDRKVWLPSGGSLVIDRTEAMTVVDVNTGKFTGSGGNLEETVTKNNLEAAEEIVRQLRLRDIGGIIVVDFIDMVLESNRDLVLRRLVECLGRDRTRHQVAEVTSLGLVQMTRKRIGTGLLEAFSESCEHCQGRGLILHHEPVEPKKKGEDESRRGRRGRGRGGEATAAHGGNGVPSPKDIAAMAKHEEQPEREGEEARVEASESTSPAEAEAPEGAVGGEAEEPTETKPAGRGRGGRGRGGRGRGGREAAPEGGEEPAAKAVEPTEPPVAAEAKAAEPVAAEAKRAEEPAGAEPAPVAEPAGEDEAVGPPKGAEEEPAEAAPAEPVAPAAPKIVTTVRRRGARRAAGPPSGAAAPATVGVTAQAAGANGTAPEETSATAATGPTPDSDVDGAAAAASTPDGEDAVETPATPHVPVKKRGSRRR